MPEESPCAPCHPEGQVEFSRRTLMVAGTMFAVGTAVGVEAVFPRSVARAALGPVIWPVGRFLPDPNVPGQKYNGYPGHKGHDFVRTPMAGDPVYAMAAGYIFSSYWVNDPEWGACGNQIWIQHQDGVQSRYLHLGPGQRTSGSVAAGSLIGTVGPSLGTRCCSVAHLHLEIKVDGVHVDPWIFLETYADGTGSGPEEDEDEMKPKVFERTEGGREVMVVAPWLSGPSELERGYRVLLDPVQILAVERMYARGSGTADKVNRDGYIAIQVQARIDHAAWKLANP